MQNANRNQFEYSRAEIFMENFFEQIKSLNRVYFDELEYTRHKNVFLQILC